MKDNHSSIFADVCYSLEWYLLVLACAVSLAWCTMEKPAELCVKLLAAAVCYPAMALTVRRVSSPVLRIIIPCVLAAGAIALGSSAAECIFLGAVALFAAVCGIFMDKKLDGEPSLYTDMLYFCGLLAVLFVVLWKADAQEALAWVGFISVLYLPLCVVSIMLMRAHNSLRVFDGRSDQPIGKIKKRFTGQLLIFAAMVMLVLLVLPRSSGSSLPLILVELCFMAIGGLFYILSGLFSSCIEEEASGMQQAIQQEAGQPAAESGWLDIVLGVLLLAAVVALAVGIIRLLIRALRGYLHRTAGTATEKKENADTIEKIAAVKSSDEGSPTGGSNAAKIRRIYEKRVRSLLGKDKNLRNSLTTAEIAALCRKKGQDISSLTALYRKARYTRSCTSEDVREARRLSRIK